MPYKFPKDKCPICEGLKIRRSLKCRKCSLTERNKSEKQIAIIKRKHAEGKMYVPSGYWKGKKRPRFSREWRKSMSVSLKGREPWNKVDFSGEKQFRRSFEYREWREFTFKRDDWTCLRCGQVGCKLNCHHLLNYAKYKDKRVDRKNGTTMCKECHKLFHKIYGIKNNNGSQFLNFIEYWDDKALKEV